MAGQVGKPYPQPQGNLLQRLRAWWVRRSAIVFALNAPRAQVLDNIPGGEHNLLHKNQLREDLRVEFDLWAFSEPSPDGPDVLELFLDDLPNPVAVKRWTSAVTPDQLFILLPQRYLTEGVHTLFYRVTLGAIGTSSDSHALDFTVSTTVPDLGTDAGRLQFPAEVESGLTARYLELHDDQVQALVPNYFPQRAGDQITWYWELAAVGSLVMGQRTLTAPDIGVPLLLTFVGALIRDLGDGQRFVTYDVTSRAGYTSRLSRPVILQVDAAPVPRNWPAPTVHDSAGNQVYGSLNPLQALNGVTVRVPATATFHPNEVARVQWGASGAPGATEASAPIIGNGPWAAPIGKAFIAAHMGKSLTVRYGLQGDDRLPPSQPLTINVGLIPKSSFPTVQSTGGTAGSGRLSLNSVPQAGDPLRLAPWPFIAAAQKIRLSAQGTLSTGAADIHWVLNGAEVTRPEVTSGIARTLPRTWLTQLRLNTPLTLRVAVSFDGGERWVDFPDLPLTLVA